MQNKPYGVIYKATNIVNGKIYIGQTVATSHTRRLRHESASRKEKPRYHFHRALKKHGLHNFRWQEITSCVNADELNQKECYYISEFNSYKFGYNSTLGGSKGTLGKKCSEATKKLISLKKTGIPLSEEHKRKLSESHSGIKKSKKHVDNVAHAKSQFWEIVHPNGNIQIIRNLSLFCRENNISDRGMWLVANNYRNHHKGYGCKKYVAAKI